MSRRSVVDERLEETMDLFQPTARQEEQAQDEPADRAPRRKRAWEQRPENRVFGFRIGDDLNELLAGAVDEYADEGWQTTVSDVLRAWALAGREAWLAGEVRVPGKAVRSGARTRKHDDASGDASGTKR